MAAAVKARCDLTKGGVQDLDHIWFRSVDGSEELRCLHNQISRNTDLLFSKIKSLANPNERRNGTKLFNHLIQNSYRSQAQNQIRAVAAKILKELNKLYSMIDSRSAGLQTIVQSECVKEVVEIWSQYFFSCSEVKQLGTGYVHNKIAGFYRKATESARKSEKELRQVQRRLYAEIITCRKKSAKEYALCLMSNRSLFELEPDKFGQAKLVDEKRKITAKEQDDQNANISLKGKVGKLSSEVLKKPAFEIQASESKELKFQRGIFRKAEGHSKMENLVKVTEAKASESSIHGSLNNGTSYRILEKHDTRKRIYHDNRKSFAFTWPTKSYPNKAYGKYKYGHRKDYHLKDDGKVKHQHSSLFCRKSRCYVGFKSNKRHRTCRPNTIENGEICKKLDFFKEEWVQCEVNHPIKQSKSRIPLPIHKLGSQNESNIEAHLKRIGAYKKTETN